MKLKLQFENLNKPSNSTAQPVISGAKIYSYSIDLPPLPIQRAIVTKSETKIEKSKQEADYEPASVLLKKIKKS